jgi:hypothetical protein
MEPLLDKLARQKTVRMIFQTIRTCDKQSDKVAKMPVVRFIGSTICAMVLVFGLFLLALVFPDSSQPFSFFFCVIAVIWAVIAWPFIAVAFIFHGDLPDISLIPVWILTGMFWAAVIELFIKLKRRKMPNKSPEPTAVGAVSSAVAVHVTSRRWLSFFR